MLNFFNPKRHYLDSRVQLGIEATVGNVEQNLKQRTPCEEFNTIAEFLIMLNKPKLLVPSSIFRALQRAKATRERFPTTLNQAQSALSSEAESEKIADDAHAYFTHTHFSPSLVECYAVCRDACQ